MSLVGKMVANSSRNLNLFETLAFPFTSYGINAAAARIVARNQAGVVLLASEDYQITDSIPLVNGVIFRGAGYGLSFTTNIPDQDFTVTSGTRLIVSAGINCFYANNTPNATIPSNLAVGSPSSCGVEDLAIIGGRRGIDTGAIKKIGVQWAKFSNIIVMHPSDEAYHFENNMHTNYSNLYWKAAPEGGGGICWQASLGNTLLPGNSQVTGEIYGHATNFKSEGFKILGIGGQQNELGFKGARLQFNRHGLLTASNVVLTANSTQNFVVSDNAQFDLCQIGMPLAIPTGSADSLGLTNGTVYFVVSRNISTNTITLNDSPLQSSANITATGNGNITVKCGGQPAMLIAGDSSGSVTASNLGGWDLECKGAVATVVTRNAKGAAFIHEIMPSDTATGFALRNTAIGFDYIDGTPITVDSLSNVASTFRQINAGPWTHSSGNIVLGPEWNGRKVRFTGTSDITVTVPRLPRGFNCKFFCDSTGQITWVEGTGTFLRNRSATLKTQGPNAETEIQHLSSSSGGTIYKVSGDLGG